LSKQKTLFLFSLNFCRNDYCSHYLATTVVFHNSSLVSHACRNSVIFLLLFFFWLSENNSEFYLYFHFSCRYIFRIIF
jgi:hypothetical protein